MAKLVSRCRTQFSWIDMTVKSSGRVEAALRVGAIARAQPMRFDSELPFQPEPEPVEPPAWNEPESPGQPSPLGELPYVEYDLEHAISILRFWPGRIDMTSEGLSFW